MNPYKILVIVLVASLQSLKLFSHVAESSTPATRYVAPSGLDVGDCRSPGSPCRTIQYAVSRAVSGDRILVAAGTYFYQPLLDPCPFLQTRAVVCFVDKRLSILGGYSTANWSRADPTRNLTVIDGQDQYRGVAAIGYNTTNAHLEMAGFTIQNCRVEGPSYLQPYDPSGVGGGMLVQHASVTLRDMIFRNNKVFGQNTQSGAGGQADGSGLRIEEPPPGTVSLLQRVIFDGNQSYGGYGPERGGIAFGALFIYKAAVVVEDSIFRNNLARAGNTTGSGFFAGLHADALGAGVAVEEGTITLRRITVVGNRIEGGSAQRFGGGAFGAGIFVEDFKNNVTSVAIEDSYVANNIAIAGTASGLQGEGGKGAGGGIGTADATVRIERTIVVSNSVIGGNAPNGTAGPGAGGGLYLFATRDRTFHANLFNLVIAGNSARQGSLGTKSLGNGGGVADLGSTA